MLKGENGMVCHVMFWSIKQSTNVEALIEDLARTWSSTVYVPHRFLTRLALYDLAPFLTGLWNATDDGSIFQHCFTCSKWNHMLHRTASLLSVIGSTCTVKPKVKQSRHSRQSPATPPFLSSPGSGVPHSGPGQVAGHIAEPERIYWTSWPGIICQIQFNGTTVSCVLRTFQGSGTEIWVAFESLWRKEALTSSPSCYKNTSKYSSVHLVRSVMSGHDRPWKHGRTIRLIDSYIPAFSIRERLHKGRIYDIY